MKLHDRVVWTRGMFLSSHHFQAQDQYVEDELQFRSALERNENWGVVELEINEGAVEGRKIQLVRCAGVMPDGLAFRLTGNELPKEGRSFADLLTPEVDELAAYLGVPVRVIDGQNVSDKGGPSLRFIAVDSECVDEYDGQKDTIQVAMPNLRLVFGTESTDGMTVLKIGRITRNGGVVQLDPEFIPPCLSIGASAHIMERLLPTLLELLKLVRSKLVAARSERSDYLADFSESDIQRFWVLDVVNRVLPELNHLYSISGPRKRRGQENKTPTGGEGTRGSDLAAATPRGTGHAGVHPEELYRVLLRLAGGLCTFSTEFGPLDFPRYDHENLGECFSELTRRIERMLKSVAYPPAKFEPIPLTSAGGEWQGHIEDKHLQVGNKFYLALRVNARLDLVKFIEDRKVRVCGADLAVDLWQRDLEGAVLEYARRPPRGLPTREGSTYFHVARGSLEWNDVEETHEVRISTRPGPSDPPVEAFEVDLFVLLAQTS